MGTIKIGQASIGESGKAKNNKAGNNSGSELNIKQAAILKGKDWKVYRHTIPEIAERIAIAMEKACKNLDIGYDQNNREALYNNVKSKGYDPSRTTAKVETDCSALVRVCVAYALQTPINTFTTLSEPSVLSSDLGFVHKDFDKDIGSTTNLKRGDILRRRVNGSGHTMVVLENGDGSVSKYDTNKQYPFGYDLSDYQWPVQWMNLVNVNPKYHLNGKDFQDTSHKAKFVILKCCSSKKEQQHFIENATAAINAGIPWGAYSYSYSKTESEAITEATRTIEMLKQVKNATGSNFKKPFGVFVDMEDESIKDLSKSALTNQVIYFCREIEKNGYKAGCYANVDWFTNQINISSIKNEGYLIWMAKWANQSFPPSVNSVTPDIWQRSGDSGDFYYYGKDSNLVGSTCIDTNYIINSSLISSQNTITFKTDYSGQDQQVPLKWNANRTNMIHWIKQ